MFCGIRENCINHKYVKQDRDDYILALVNGGKVVFNNNGENIVLSENNFYVIHSNSDISYIADRETP